MTADGRPVSCIVVQDRHAVFVEQVVKFLIDGIEADCGGEREA
jgi:hypothetical protein